jgi:hypothetical protein
MRRRLLFQDSAYVRRIGEVYAASREGSVSEEAGAGEQAPMTTFPQPQERSKR